MFFPFLSPWDAAAYGDEETQSITDTAPASCFIPTLHDLWWLVFDSFIGKSSAV